MKKRLPILILIFVAIVGLIITFYLIYLGILNINGNTRKTNNPSIINQDNFSLLYEYKGNNQWEYEITGTLPNPCYSYQADIVVMESYPEQVVVSIEIKIPAEDMMCIQVIEEVNESGEFSASEDASVNLVVK